MCLNTIKFARAHILKVERNCDSGLHKPLLSAIGHCGRLCPIPIRSCTQVVKSKHCLTSFRTSNSTFPLSYDHLSIAVCTVCLTFNVHHEHLPALLEALLQQRSPFILRDVHIIEQFQETLVHLSIVKAVDQLRRLAARLSRRNGAPHSTIMAVV